MNDSISLIYCTHLLCKTETRTHAYIEIKSFLPHCFFNDVVKSNLDLWYSCGTQIKMVSLLSLNFVGFTRSARSSVG